VSADARAPLMSRRRLLGVLAGAGAVVGVGGVAGVVRIATGGDDYDGVIAGIRRVGRAHLDSDSTSGREQDLRRGLPDGWVPPTEEPLPQLTELGDAVAADFTEGRTVEVAGWRLSETEARAAALIAIETGAR
jgi:hypothetical protein